MLPLDEGKKAEALTLLANTRRLLPPQCVHPGEELAYIACRDSLINRVAAIIEGGTRAASSPLGGEDRISVNQQELALSMIRNTFDQHKNLLRKRIHDLEQQVALLKNGAKSDESTSSSEYFAPCCATSSVLAHDKKDAHSLKGGLDHCLACKHSWMQEALRSYTQLLDAKTELFVAALSCIALECVKTGRCLDRASATPKHLEDAETEEPIGGPRVCAGIHENSSSRRGGSAKLPPQRKTSVGRKKPVALSARKGELSADQLGSRSARPVSLPPRGNPYKTDHNGDQVDTAADRSRLYAISSLKLTSRRPEAKANVDNYSNVTKPLAFPSICHSQER